MSEQLRAQTLAAFSALTGVPRLARVIQRGRDPELARYTLELADGRVVRVGTMKVLASQTELGRVLGVTIGYMPPLIERADWHGAIRALINFATDVEEPKGETFEETVADWVRSYSARASSDRDGAAPAGAPFCDEDELYLTATGLAKYVRREFSEQVKLHDLRVALRDIGFEQETVRYARRNGRGTKKSSTSYYRAPLHILEDEGGQS